MSEAFEENAHQNVSGFQTAQIIRLSDRRSHKLQIMAGEMGKLGLTACMGLLLLTGRAEACGDFRLPKTHFEGVNEEGCVSRWEQLENLDVGSLQVPLIIGFQTYKHYSSPELGDGWILPLLDASIVQNDENSFGMIQPDGWRASFGRDASNPNILHGSGGWTAEIQGDHITVYSSCGSGWKMVFTQGKITSLSKGDHTLTITRDQLGRATEVRDGPKIVMTLEQDQVTGLAKSITMGEKKYELSYDAKPRVETISGVNLVGGVDQSLHKIMFSDGKNEIFDFAVTDKLLPNLKITDTAGKEKTIAWDTAGHILQDGEWKYKVIPAQPGENYAAIERKNQSNQSEFWHHDDAKGEEVTQGLDGTKEIKTWFTSGVLAGKFRKEEMIRNGKSTVLRQCAYNEQGKLIRKINSQGIATLIKYDENGKLLSRSVDASDPAIKAQEAGLLQSIANAKKDAEHNAAIKKLCFFYIHTLRMPDKATPLIEKLTDQKMRFSVLYHLIAYDNKLTPEQKISSYISLMRDYPDNKSILEQSIAKQKNKKTA